MMHLLRFLLSILLPALLLAAMPAHAQAPGAVLPAAGAANPATPPGPRVVTPQVEATLVSGAEAVAPGARVWVGLNMVMARGWHTYWRNPGESGLPTEITWTLPPGAEVGPIVWPAPTRQPFDTLMNYGFSGEVLLAMPLTVPANARPGQTLRLEAQAFWLVCERVCIPQDGFFAIEVPVAASTRADATWGPRLEAAVAAAPRPAPKVKAVVTAGTAPGGTLSVQVPAGTPLAEVLAGAGGAYFFAFEQGAVLPSVSQGAQADADTVAISLTGTEALPVGGAPLAGVVALEDADGRVLQVFEIAARPGPVPVLEAPRTLATLGLPATVGAAGAAADPSTAGLGLLAALVFAFLGGMILNLMPCVFPVLAVKAVSFTGRAAHEGPAIRREGLAYGAGVLVTFLALAGLLIALRAGGEVLGWGFQLQEPWLVLVLALLFTAMGAMLLTGVGFGAPSGVGEGATRKGGPWGAFATGALAVVVASPCTGPFMGSAMGWALVQPAHVTLAVFTALALGFAAPFMALAFVPRIAERLPRPGPWMERLRQGLAFPMFGAAVWLGWVLAVQTGPSGALVAAGGAVVTGFAVWALAQPGALGWRVAALASAVVLALGAARFLPDALNPAPAPAAAITAQAFSPERVAALNAEGRTVFVNFTAAWCASCKVNEATVLSGDGFRRTLEDADAVYLVADWTRRDAVIAAELARFGRSAVPLYVVYPPAGAPVVLGDGLITLGQVRQSLTQAREAAQAGM
jgi:thiol:disulfide interchange protein DsbD